MQSLAEVVPLVTRVNRLAAIHAAETGLKIRLTKAPVSVNLSTVLADLTPVEADFDDYTPGGIAPTWTTGEVDVNGNAINETQMVTFVVATDLVTNTIYNVWVDDGTDVLMAFELPNPVALNRVGASLKIVIQDSYPPGVPSIVVYP